MLDVSEPEHWEYHIEAIHLPASSADQLDQLGEEGWELVSTQAGEANRCFLFFKRLRVKKKASGGMGFGR